MRSRHFAAAALVAAVGAVTLAACRSDEVLAPAAPQTPPAVTAAVALDQTRREAMAEQFARSLADADFRALVRQSLAQSPMREHKMQFQRWTTQDPMRLRALAGLSARPIEALQAEVLAAPALEFYFPVKGDEERWDGGTNLLVATVGGDHEAPVAFDMAGRRVVLDAKTPPSVPVLALVPQESDFDAPVRTADLYVDDSPGGVTPDPAGLYLTQATYLQSFEGWLKGDPEFDIHVLGKAAGKDSMTTLSCSGRTAQGLYNYRQASLEWTGRALLYTTAQLEAYQAANPGQGFRVFVVEDDDGACVMKTQSTTISNTIATIERLWPQITGGLLKGLPLSKRVEAARALIPFVGAIANFFKTNDDVVGNAVEARVTGEVIPTGNWVVKGENATTTGYLTLELRN